MNPSKAVYLSVAELIGARQAEVGKTSHQLATDLGYRDERIVELIKSGAMRLPVTKVSQLSNSLKLPPAPVLRMLLRESDVALLDALEEVLGSISQDFDVVEAPDFANRTVMQLATEGKIRLLPDGSGDEMEDKSDEELEPAALSTARGMRLERTGVLPPGVALLDALGDPYLLSKDEATLVYAYRAKCNGQPATFTLELPEATAVLIAPRGR